MDQKDVVTNKLFDALKDNDVQTVIAKAIDAKCNVLADAMQGPRNDAEQEKAILDFARTVESGMNHLPADDKARIEAVGAEAKAAGVTSLADTTLGAVLGARQPELPIVKEAADRCAARAGQKSI